MDFLTIESTHTSGFYSKHPLVITRGSGAILWDDQNREYLDCMGGHGVTNLGHCHPDIIQAVTEQLNRLITLPETYYNDVRAMLLEKIAHLVPGMDRIFFCNSGTESIEAAIKFARLSTGRSGIIASMRGFHGRTLGALSATWNKTYRQPFEPLVPGFDHVPYNNFEALANIISDHTAAVILEIIQGEGGVHLADPEYLIEVQNLCQKNGTLLIIDEVQTGYGRTGKFFAFQHHELQPDLVCIAKSMAGGIPMGGVLIGRNVTNISTGLHGSTFGGNPLACAAALRTIDVIRRDRLEKQAEEKGTYLINELRRIDSLLIREVRGLGLIIGIELKQKVSPYLQEMSNLGLLALPAGMTVIRLLPPLVITYEQLDEVVKIIRQVLTTNDEIK